MRTGPTTGEAVITTPDPTSSRPFCLRCRRPEVVCVCGALRPVDSRTRVVFLQHPREARVPVSTCRLAHLSLPNSEMHVGLRAEGSRRLEALVRDPGTMVLFPGPGSTDVRDLPAPPRNLLVVDGTWINARKVLQRSPLLASLPRVGFVPEQPGNYRIRKEPAPECVSTIEAVAYVLEQLEQAPGRFVPMLAPFERMVDLQLAYVASQTGRGRRKHAAPGPSVAEQLRSLGDRLVVVFVEANVWRAESPDSHCEIVQWVAVRPTTGDRFESRLRPVRALAAHIPRYLGISEAELLAGESMAEASGRWRAFARPDDVVSTWGTYATDLLVRDGVSVGEPLDLKRAVSNVLQSRTGGVEQLAERLGTVLPHGEGRGARQLAAIEGVLTALREGRVRRGG